MAMLLDIASNLIAATMGAVLGYSARWIYAKARMRLLNKAVRSFFGAPSHTYVIHSAIHDPPPVDAWNYPATDMRAARRLVILFERIGLKEGINFSVVPDKDLVINSSLWSSNIVLICGPAKNAVFRDLAPAISLRHKMTVDPADGSNVLTDTMTGARLSSSRQLPESPGPFGHDFALIASLPNPRNLARRIVVLAGIHGVGTVGATEFVEDLKRLRSLEHLRRNGAISAVARVEYDSSDRDNPRWTPELV